VGTALGCSLATPAHAEKVVFNGTGDFSATRTDTLTDTAQVVDARTTAGNLTLNFSAINVSNNSGAQGSGIYGQVTGAGNVAITSGTLTASGADVIFGLDARTTTGNVSITSGTTTSNNNALSRGIHVNANGAITITAGEAHGGQRGIFTGGNNGGFPTIVNITSTTATANGVSQPNAIVGQGATVNIVSGTASNTATNGSSGAAIFTNSGTSTVKSTTVNLAGLNQSGIQITANTGSSSIDSGTITAAQAASGIVVGLSGTTGAGATVKSGTINLNGANSVGIDVAASGTTGAIAVDSTTINAASTSSTGIRGTTAGNSTIKSGTISFANAAGGTGITWTATGGATTSIDSGTITGGGISVTPASGATTVKSDTITRGRLDVQGGTGAISITSTRIEGTGTGVGIINASNFGGAATDGVTVVSTTITGSGGGISASSQGAVSVDSGSIVQTATLPTNPASANSLQGAGISVNASGAGAATIKSGSVAFTGTGNTYGIQLQAVGGGTGTINSGSVSVVGNGGYGILGYSTSGALTINSTGNVTTTGTTRAAGGSTLPQNQRYADGIDAISQSGAISVTSGGTVSTSGATARGINVEAGRAQTNFGTAVTTPSTAAISVTSTGSVTTTGANSTGIRIAGDNGAITLASKNASTTGVGASAIGVTSNAGTIAVTSDTATSSGSGVFTIDARSTTGDITINAGSTTGNASPLGRGIHAVTGGAITITAGETNGGQRGIHTSAGGAVKITSTTATANGVSAANAIVGQGTTVDITSGTASLTSSQATGGAAIFTNSATSTIKSTAVNLAGLNQAGIQINANAGTSSIDSGTVTAAQSATGISVGLSGSAAAGATVKSGAINLNGANSFGIDVAAAGTTGAIAIDSAAINAASTNSVGIRGTTAGNATIKSGAISFASTSGGTGINWTANGAATTAIDSATITGGGINVTAGTGATTVKSDTMTRGSINAGNGAGAVTVISNRIEAAGSSAISAQNFGGAATDGVSVASTAITGTGGGISASSQGAVSVDSGSIVQTATLPTNPASANSLQGIGISVIGSGTGAATVKSGSIAYTGTGNSFGIQVQAVGGGTGNITSGSVSVVGNGGYGILGYSTTGALAIASTGNVTTTGTTRAVGGSTAPANQRYADGIVALSQGGAITVSSGGTVSTAGANADGITVEAGRAITTFGTAATAASTAAISVTNSGTVTTAGAGSTGIRVAADNNAVTLVSKNVTTSGANAHGIDVTGGTGALTVTTGNVATTGATADAVRIVSASGPITATVDGTLSAASGTGLFIDPPSAVTINVAANGVARGSVNGISTVGATNAITNLGTVASTGAGAAILASGTTTLANSGTITGGSAGIAVQLGATNDAVTLGTGSSVTGAIAGGGGTDSATLAGTANTATATQTIARFTGFDSLNVASGYWTAAPANGSAFNRATIAAGAALELANAGAGLGLATPSIVDNGTLVVRSTAAGTGSTFGTTTVTGTGNVLLTGAGTVTLDGTNSLANSGTIAIEGGTTAILTGTQGGNVVTNAGGTFQIGNGGTTGTFTGGLVDNGTLVVARSDDYVFDGALTGSGAIIKQGAGKLTFGTGYAFTGTTTINGGSVRLSTPVAATTELAVEGSGQLDLSGTQQVVAELAGTSTQASVNIAGGSLSVNQATNSSFAGNLTGAGSLTKTGTGTLNLTGVNTYTGPTAVNGGTLAVNGSIASAVTVNAGGSLGGTGRVASATIGRAGRMTPGNSIGTLNVAGPVSFAADSIYEVEINADGRSDRVVATGPATLAGGTVTVLPEAGSFAKTTTYNILTASAVTGQFAGVTSTSAVFVPLLGYTATGVTLTVARRDLSFGAIATTPNQLAVATAADARNPGNPVFNAVILLPTAAAGQAAFNELSGEIFSSVPTVLVDEGRRVREAVLDRATAGGDGFGVWATGLLNSAESNARRGEAEADADRKGVVSGIDFGRDGWRLGAAAGYVDSEIDVAARASTADVESKLVSLYAGWTGGRLTAQLGGSYTWHDVDTTRSITSAGLAGATRSSFDGKSTQGFGELSYSLLDGPFTVAPFIGYAHVRTKTDALAEAGTPAALAVAATKRDLDFATLGLRFGGSAPLSATLSFNPKFAVSYQRAWGDLGAPTVATFGGTGTAFGVTGARLGKDSYNVDGGFELVTGAFRIGAGGYASTSSEWSDFGAKATLGFSF
jgi:uncharacterized protein with beta-barrel porin domain